MNLLNELKTMLDTLQLPLETGVFSDIAPDRYVVLIPLVDTFELQADDQPCYETQEVRISLFTKGNYLQPKRRIEAALLLGGITISERRYVGFEAETGYHHYAMDVAKHYAWED